MQINFWTLVGSNVITSKILVLKVGVDLQMQSNDLVHLFSKDG